MKSIHFGFGKIITISILTFLLIASCDVTDPKKDRPKREGYQEDIPWPSLADSPWPMNNHDPQNTGRIKESFNLTGSVESIIPSNFCQTGIVLTEDSLIIFLSIDSLNAYDLNGKPKFKHSLPFQSYVTPLTDKDGYIYTGSNVLPEIYIFNKTGELLHKVKIDNPILNSSLNIDKDGLIYCLDMNCNLYSINKSGEIIWKTKIEEANQNSFGISFSPDGTILYIPGKSSSIIAFDVKRISSLWKYGDIETWNTPLVDSQGNIYILPKYEYKGKFSFKCLLPNGKIKWEYEFENNGKATFNSNSPSIDKYGNIYFATDTLYSLNFNGKLRWKRALEGFSDSHLVIDEVSNIFVGLMGVEGSRIGILCFDSAGNRKWEIFDLQMQIGGSPALGFNRLFYPSWRGDKIYIIN